ncbi:hypothetical protein VI26_02405 [Chromobacterium sp. LK1]|nr:hypothetical protein VI26_02405 [Chromobacterium sp. LK1]
MQKLSASMIHIRQVNTGDFHLIARPHHHTAIQFISGNGWRQIQWPPVQLIVAKGQISLLPTALASSVEIHIQPASSTFKIADAFQLILIHPTVPVFVATT